MKARLSIGAIALVCASDARATEPATAWAEATSSPTPIPEEALTDRESDLLAHCGAGEAGLRAVAQRLVMRRMRDLPFLDLEGLSFAQRAVGEPHVWPRAWVIAGRAMDHETTLRKMDEWRASFRDLGERRCGVATAFRSDGTEIIAAVAVDAVADLSPLPVRGRTGAWLTVDATLAVPASSAKVVVQGPGSDPRPVPTSFDGGRVRARFALDRPGAFTVQVVANVGTGPRPVLEASLFADVDPPSSAPSITAPGEAAGAGISDAKLSLTRMIEVLRTEERLPLMARDPRLDDLAHAHAMRMHERHAVGHDVGDGDPAQRVSAAGVPARIVAENVAHAPSIPLAHRALYASPSHRANLLRADFDKLGVAVIPDADGSVWVTELFTSGLR